MEYGSRSHAETNIVWICIVVAVGLLMAFVAYTFWPTTLGDTEVSIGAKTFQAEVVDTEEGRVAGLSGRSALAADQAMLMVYDHDAVWPIKTVDNKMIVDIAWITSDKKIAYIAREAKPSATATYSPAGKSRYVLLLPSGALSKYGIAVGRQVNFDYGG